MCQPRGHVCPCEACEQSWEVGAGGYRGEGTQVEGPWTSVWGAVFSVGCGEPWQAAAGAVSRTALRDASAGTGVGTGWTRELVQGAVRRLAGREVGAPLSESRLLRGLK